MQIYMQMYDTAILHLFTACNVHHMLLYIIIIIIKILYIYK